MSVASQWSSHNAQYVSGRKAEQLPLPPAKKVALVTCMDARILPSVALGINEGDSHVIRNAGASAKDALRSLVISQQLLATEEIVVIKHTDCGMLTFTTPQARELVAKNLELDASSSEAKYLESLDFLEFPELEQAVKDDVQLLKDSKLIKSDKISGWIYDVKTGGVKQIV